MYNLFDKAISDALDVSVAEYIRKIESISHKDATIIIELVLDGKVDEAKELFNKIL